LTTVSRSFLVPAVSRFGFVFSHGYDVTINDLPCPRLGTKPGDETQREPKTFGIVHSARKKKTSPNENPSGLTSVQLLFSFRDKADARS
jgi:hypothetical protein